jgi:hypothetical protein
MMMKRTAVGALSFTLVASLSTVPVACSRANEAAGEVAPARAIGLRVRNDNFLDMDVYVVSDALATRLGTVTGNSSRNFVLDASLATQDLRIVATPIGGNGRASTGLVTVAPGQTIDFTIGSVLRNSTVTIR